MHRITPFQRPLFPKKNVNASHPGGISRSTIDRLSRPRPKDPRWLPDKPSVYWLDYLIDPTPHRITDVDELQSYYDKYESKYPRTIRLAQPRPYYGTLYRDRDWEQKISMNTGIPLSALNYQPTKRINRLATPKRDPSYSSDLPWLYIPGLSRPRGKSGKEKETLKRSFLTGAGGSYPQADKPQVQKFKSNDSLAKGDFKSRSKHGLQNSREGNPSVGKGSPKARSLSRTKRTNAGGGGGGDVGSTTSFSKRSTSLGRK